jgi:glutathione synthase/RimK-type ligase-like ATP-grasp enzyme
MPTVALATCAALPALDDDSRVLIPALQALGIDASPVVWSDPAVRWDAFDLVVVRSTWDYSARRDEFLAWADRVDSGRLWNPARLLRWNTHKRYLREFDQGGVPIVPTRWHAAGTTVDLAEVMDTEGWPAAIVKPAVSAGARHTMLVDRTDPVEGQALLDQELRHRDMMIQPYLASVARSGELSLLYFNGNFSHAVRKSPAPGDFRVQERHGGTTVSVEATPVERAAGRRVLGAVSAETLYARVDFLPGPGGNLLLAELEIVEPSMFLRMEAAAASRFAEGIARRLAR